MTLLTRLNSLPLWRMLAMPPYFRQVCLMVSSRHISLAKAFAHRYPETSILRIALIDGTDGAPAEYRFTMGGKEMIIPVSGLEGIFITPHLEKVYCIPPDDLRLTEFGQLCRVLAEYQVNSLSLVELAKNPRHTPARAKGNLYREHARELEDIHAGLADEDSKNAYAARVKAYLTGDSGYLPIASFEEYYHPLVSPEPGDIMIDGGVSDMVEVQQKFAASVGPAGQIHGFEPIAAMHAAAAETLREFPQYSLHCMGLGERTENLHFMMKRDSSHVCAEAGEETVTCRVTSLDDFVEEKKLTRVDCIKLDVEGSELAALKGAADTIRKHKPKLIVCLYHKVEDIITLPGYVKELVPGYELRVAHHSAFFNDSILYARY